MVEDDTYGLLRFEGEALPTLFELSEHQIVYSTSLSTIIAPGLRVGAFILPDALAGELANTANSTYISPVLLAQATVFEFMQRGSLEPHVEMLRERLVERRDATLAALEQHFEGAAWTRPEGGFFIMLVLPPGTNAKFVVDGAEGVTATGRRGFRRAPERDSPQLRRAGVRRRDRARDRAPPSRLGPECRPLRDRSGVHGFQRLTGNRQFWRNRRT